MQRIVQHAARSTHLRSTLYLKYQLLGSFSTSTTASTTRFVSSNANQGSNSPDLQKAHQTTVSIHKEPTSVPSKQAQPADSNSTVKAETVAKKKTIAELDEELKLKLEGISGEGGAAGLEYENGTAVAMKRGVRENMFRLI